MRSIHGMTGAWLLIAGLLAGLSTQAGLMVREGTTRIHQMTAGETQSNTVVLVNTSKDESMTVSLRLVDYAYSKDGTVQFPEAGTLPQSNAKWMRPIPPEVTLKPEEAYTLDYRLTVPEEGVADGTYWCVIMAEPVDPPDADEKKNGSMQIKIRQTVQIVTNVGDTGTEALKVTDLTVSTEKEKPRKAAPKEGAVPEAADEVEKRYLTFAVESTGTLWLRPDIWVELFDAEGEAVARLSAGQPRRIYPGCSLVHKLELGEIAPGTYQAVLVIKGKTKTFASQVEVDIGD